MNWKQYIMILLCAVGVAVNVVAVNVVAVILNLKYHHYSIAMACGLCIGFIIFNATIMFKAMK